MKDPEDAKKILDVIVTGADDFLKSEIGVLVNSHSQHDEVVGRFYLKPLTALMSISGEFKLNITFSFDTDLIEQIFKVYCSEIDIGEDEKLQYIDETASDMINIVIGNSTGLLSAGGTIVDISVPYVINEDESFSVPEIKFVATTLYTDFGDMMITAILNTSDSVDEVKEGAGE
jgi:CheY-specific phosphatase CheX